MYILLSAGNFITKPQFHWMIFIVLLKYEISLRIGQTKLTKLIIVFILVALVTKSLN